jgi:hypothetical protein
VLYGHLPVSLVIQPEALEHPADIACSAIRQTQAMAERLLATEQLAQKIRGIQAARSELEIITFQPAEAAEAEAELGTAQAVTAVRDQGLPVPTAHLVQKAVVVVVEQVDQMLVLQERQPDNQADPEGVDT